LDGASKFGNESGVFDGIDDVDSAGLDEVLGGFAGVVYGFPAGAVDGVEIEDLVFAVRIPYEVSQDGVHASGCVRDVYHRSYGNVEDFGNGFSGLVQELGVLITDKWVWLSFGLLLELSVLIADCNWVCTEGTYGL
jgi:hypothetical protein